jgi:prefoldin alpha subunit
MSQPQTTINISDLDITQLSEVRKQLEEVSVPVMLYKYQLLTCFQELNHLTNSFAQLKQAQAKFKGCIENVNEVKKENKGGVFDES